MWGVYWLLIFFSYNRFHIGISVAIIGQRLWKRAMIKISINENLSILKWKYFTQNMIENTKFSKIIKDIKLKTWRNFYLYLVYICEFSSHLFFHFRFIKTWNTLAESRRLDEIYWILCWVEKNAVEIEDELKMLLTSFLEWSDSF
jgi:hypothetical protein